MDSKIAKNFFRKSLDKLQRDSGSESAPLLSSSCSLHTSQNHLQPCSVGMFLHVSETSDLDSSPPRTSASFRFSHTVTTVISNYNPISSLLSKRVPPPLVDKIISPVDSTLPAPFLRNNKYYDIHKTDLLLGDVSFDASSQIRGNRYFDKHLIETLPVVTNIDSTTNFTKPKQSSLVTIFSVWNTILGSSMLTMPWGIYMAGFIPSILLILTMSAICLFTAYKLLQVHKYHGGDEKIEVVELSRIYLGPWAENVSKIFSISVLMGANIAYWILMSNFLYNSINFLYDIIFGMSLLPAFHNNSDDNVLCLKDDIDHFINYEKSYNNLGPVWDLYKTVPIFLAVLVFPILNFNTITFFTKFNSLGTVAIMYLIVFVLIKSASWGINMDKIIWEESWILRPTFPVLSGMLSLSFFIHNIIITIMQSNRNQKKNGRDLTIAYILVTITYIIVGTSFYICFPLKKVCIEDNLLNNFQKNDGITVGARFILLFQLFTLYPLIAYMLRIQLLSSVFKTTFSQNYTLVINFIIVTVCVLFAVFMPHVGTIIRYTGAFSGLIYVFTLPSLLHLVILYRQGTITIFQIFCHTCVLLIGVLNFVSQFFIRAI